MLANIKSNENNTDNTVALSFIKSDNCTPNKMLPNSENNEQAMPHNDFSAKRIVEVTARYYGLTVNQLKQRCRTKEVAFTRQIAAYLLREYKGESYPIIGGHLGSRDHSTMIHAHRKVKEALNNSTDLKRQISEILNILYLTDESGTSYKDTELDYDEFTEHAPLFGKKGAVKLNLPSPETIEREKNILSAYRSGLTLRQVGQEFKLSGQRIRQIVLKAIFREIENKKSEGFEIDSEEYMKQEKLRRKKTSIIKAGNNTPKNKKRWSRFYAQCRECGTTAIPHIRRGLCERCGGNLRSERRENAIAANHNKCEVCGIDRIEAKQRYGRDFYITKPTPNRNSKILCRGCFLTYSGNRMLEGRWGKLRG